MAFEHWPYTDIHDLNLDWILRAIKDMRAELADFRLYLPQIDDRNNGYWDIRYSYVPNRLVIWNDTIYIATKPVPSGTNIDNTEYWQVVATIDVYTIREEWEAYQEEVNTALETLGNELREIAKPGKTNYWNAFYFYVDQLAGSDSNPGTRELPFATVERAFEKAQEGYNDIRIHILSAGEYEISKHDFSFNVLHLIGDVSGVVLLFTSAEDVAWYNLHVNIQNLEMKGPATDPTIDIKIYFEAGMFSFTDVVFSQWSRVRVYGGSHLFERCKVPNLVISWATVELADLTITNTDPTIRGLTIDRASNVRSRGELKLTPLADVSTEAAVYVARSTFYLQNPFARPDTTMTNKYAYAITLDTGIIVARQAVLATGSRIASANLNKLNTGLIVNQMIETGSLTYVAGDSIAVNTKHPVNGTYTSNLITLSIPMDKSLENIETVTITNLTGPIFSIGGAVNSSNDTYNWASVEGLTIAASKADNMNIVVTIEGSFTNVTSQRPVTGNLSYTIRLS